MKQKYERGIELVGGVLIERKDGKILMTRSPKWNNKWVFPGGHIDPGERIIDALAREGAEETGLELKPVSLFNYGELISPKSFHRPAHFIYFDLYARATSHKIRLNEELSNYKWIYPQEALKLDLAESYPEAIKKFISLRRRLEKR